jgi:rhodanese-related sulfurtransferase
VALKRFPFHGDGVGAPHLSRVMAALCHLVVATTGCMIALVVHKEIVMFRKWVFPALFMLAALPVRASVVDIDNEQLARLLAAGVPVVDSRTGTEWRETGIVPGSHLFTFFDENGRSDPAAWLRKVQGVAKPEQAVILLCRSGNRTRVVSQLLSARAGYRTVYNVGSGIVAWARDGRPMAPAPPCPAGSMC